MCSWKKRRLKSVCVELGLFSLIIHTCVGENHSYTYTRRSSESLNALKYIVMYMCIKDDGTSMQWQIQLGSIELAPTQLVCLATNGRPRLS